MREFVNWKIFSLITCKLVIRKKLKTQITSIDIIVFWFIPTIGMTFCVKKKSNQYLQKKMFFVMAVFGPSFIFTLGFQGALCPSSYSFKHFLCVSVYIVKQNQNVWGFCKKNVDFSNLMTIECCQRLIFKILIHKTSLSPKLKTGYRYENQF